MDNKKLSDAGIVALTANEITEGSLIYVSKKSGASYGDKKSTPANLMIQEDETDAAEYSGGLANTNIEGTHDISGYSFVSAPKVILVPTCEWLIWLKSVTSTEIKIGIGEAGNVDNITYDIHIIPK